MTVCIAAICVEDKQPRLVYCVDSRLDGTYSSTDTAVKIRPLGQTSWGALLSGDDWNMADKLADHLRASLSPLSLSTHEQMFTALKEATAAFSASPFYDVNRKVDLIAGGFIGDEPLLIYTGFDRRKSYTILAGDVAVVGSGSGIASAFLKIRGVNRHMTKDRAVYAAYEAKKYSENAPSVGPRTIIWIQRPDGTCSTSGTANIQALEKARKRFGLQPAANRELPIWDNPNAYLATEEAKPNPQHPTTDQSGPKPSQE